MAITLDEGQGVSGYAGPAIFTYRMGFFPTQVIKVSFMADCYQSIDPCIPQGADRSFVFVDRNGANISAATEVTVDIWQTKGGANILSKSLTGGGVIMPADDRIMFEVTGAESAAMDAGNRHIEIWVETLGERYLLGMDTFKVIDTRKYD